VSAPSRRDKRVYRKKVSVAIDLLASILEDGIEDRERVRELLRERYEETRLSPFRGIAFPEDIYDKEMATLYVVGKYGMGLDQDFPREFERIFEREVRYERALEALLGPGSVEEKRERIKGLLGEVNSNELSRMFRLLFTRIVLGFEEEDRLFQALRAAREVFPEHERDVMKYARFYIGFRLAEKIATGEIRSKLAKEAEKQALNLSIGLGKTMPDDSYIYNIARSVFKVPREKLEAILNVNEKTRGRPQPPEREEPNEESSWH